jgi:galactonate dehydratase
VAATIRDLEPLVVGQDPAEIEQIWWLLYRKTIRSLGGIAHKAMAGINAALWDIKGKVLGVPVYQLLGGKMRDDLPLYWSHCGSARAFYRDQLTCPPVETVDDIARLAEEVVEQGYSALKTNIFHPGTPPTRGTRHSGGGIDAATIRDAETVVGTFRKYGGEDLGIALDVGFSFKMGAALQLARALEPYKLMWLETETLDAAALERIKTSTTTPICTGESLYMTHGFKPYLERHAIDVAMPDFAWNGISMGKKICDLADTYDTLIAPHNCHSPLATLISGHICLTIPNFMIMEFDHDDVPWRDDILSEPLLLENGRLRISDKPGLGADLNEAEIAKHPYRAIPGAS